MVCRQCGLSGKSQSQYCQTSGAEEGEVTDFEVHKVDCGLTLGHHKIFDFKCFF